jgi:hypothetical protein
MNDTPGHVALSRALQDIADKSVSGKVPNELHNVAQAFKIVINDLEQRVKKLEAALRASRISIPQ